MNRRDALLIGLLSGGAVSARALAQEDEFDSPRKGNNRPPSGFPEGPDAEYRTFDITRYTTKLPHSSKSTNPELGIVDWILRRTRPSTWHGGKPAALYATRELVHAYHEPKVIRQVAEIVDRFVNAANDSISLRARVVAAANPRWRYTVFSRLESIATGPQGQQVWLLKGDDLPLVLAQLQLLNGTREISNKQVDLINGQTLTMRRMDPRNYVSGIRREGAANFGAQPNFQPTEEGYELKISPLLHFDADAIELSIDLSVSSILYFIRTKIIPPRQVGPAEMEISIPEVLHSRFEQTIEKWPIGQTLLISAGIFPDILPDNRRGLLENIRMTGNNQTELLVMLTAELNPNNRLTRRARGREES